MLISLLADTYTFVTLKEQKQLKISCFNLKLINYPCFFSLKISTFFFKIKTINRFFRIPKFNSWGENSLIICILISKLINVIQLISKFLLFEKLSLRNLQQLCVFWCKRGDRIIISSTKLITLLILTSIHWTRTLLNSI